MKLQLQPSKRFRRQFDDDGKLGAYPTLLMYLRLIEVDESLQGTVKYLELPISDSTLSLLELGLKRRPTQKVISALEDAFEEKIDVLLAPLSAESANARYADDRLSEAGIDADYDWRSEVYG